MNRRARIPRVPGRAATGFAAASILLLAAIPRPACSERVVEVRTTVFENEVGGSYPKYNDSWNDDMLEVNLFYMNPYGPVRPPHYHYPGRLVLAYEACDVMPWGTPRLEWFMDALDGEGHEFDWETGLRASVRVNSWEPRLSMGVDFEEDLRAPFRNQSHEMRSTIIDLLDWAKICLVEFGLGLGLNEKLEGVEYRYPLRITNPTADSLVHFAATGTREHTLRFQDGESGSYYSWAKDTTTIVIHPLYLGPIKVEADTPRVYVFAESRGAAPELGFALLSCLPNAYTYTGAPRWYQSAAMPGSLSLDAEESDELAWDLESILTGCLPIGLKPAQDLRHNSWRAGSSAHPIPGAADTIVTWISSVYDSLCSGYSSVALTYYLDEGAPSGYGLIGAQTIDPATHTGLAAFNSGATDSFEVRWAFLPGNPAYIFTEDHAWPGGELHPRYAVQIDPVPSPPCSGWTVASALPSQSPNDRSVVPYEIPIPDFSLDGVDVAGPSFAAPTDTFTFDLRARNRGIGWPPHASMVHIRDSVFVSLRVSYERALAGGASLDVYAEALPSQLLTPIAAGDSGFYHYQYILPDEVTLQGYYPIDRLRFTFEVNDGSTPVNWAVWEQSFENNTLEWVVAFTDMVECAYPSPTLHTDGQSIAVGYPDHDPSGSCPDYVYLYVDDPSLAFVPPNTPPADVLVELGMGKCRTFPDGTGWKWAPAQFLKDFTASGGTQYKVYRADVCLLTPGPGAQSYAFRVSQDWQDLDSNFAYVDNDGFCLESGVWNVYETSRAGKVSLPCWVNATAPPLGNVGDGRGVGWSDFDADGDDDLYVTNTNGSNALMRNDGGTFVDVTTEALGMEGSNSQGVVWGDYDDDADPDLFVANASGSNVLLRNDGAAGFMDATAPPIDDPGGVARSAAWADYDQDGDLDLFVANFNTPDRLFRNDGGSFLDVSTPPMSDPEPSMGAAWGDFDLDGDPDLLVASWGLSNRLYQNDGGTFTDVAPGTPVEGIGLFTVGAAWGDYDNDGDLDLYLTNEGPNLLLRNDGGVFVDVTGSSGPAGDPGPGRSAVWEDFDLDGRLDLYVTNEGVQNHLFRNTGDTFEDETSPLEEMSSSAGIGIADYDGDGDRDIYVANGGVMGGPNVLLRNEHCSGYHWLRVKLRGWTSNSFGVGARVYTVSSAGTQLREINAGSGYLSMNPPTAEFGLGTVAMLDTLRVVWPSGLELALASVPGNQTVEVDEMTVIGVAADSLPAPPVFRVNRAQPNPFDAETAIYYEIPRAAHVSLRIFDASGRRVRTFGPTAQSGPVRGRIVWDGADQSGRKVAAGVYFYVFEAGPFRQSGKLVRLK